MSPFPCLLRTVFGLSCCALSGWSNSIAYPNQAYIFADGVSSPVPGGFNARTVAVYEDRLLILHRDGSVTASGFHERVMTNAIFSEVIQLTNIVDVGMNQTMPAILTDQGTVIELDPSSFRPQPPGLTNVIAFDVTGQAGDDDIDHILAATSDGRVAAWGRFGETLMVDIPGVVAVSGGWHHAVALLGDGRAVEWDYDFAPEIVAGLSNVVAVSAGGEHSVALLSDGTVKAWGENYYGQTDVPAGLSNVIAISASEDHNLALKSDGTLVAWGRGNHGVSITPPEDLTNVVAIATSGEWNIAIQALPVPPPQPPVLNLVADASNAGRLTLSLTGDPNRIYTIESSEELQTWQFDRFLTNETGTVTFEVEPSAGSRRFYKATTP